MVPVITIHELEKRMRAGQWSGGGFLGSTESLLDVISQDAQTLDQFKVSYEQIADKLLMLLSPAVKHTKGMSPYPNLYKPETVPAFTMDNLPDINSGYLSDNLQIFTIGYKGLQDCPWECEKFGDFPGSFDFLIINRETGEFITGPALIIHLIREHHFFEGVESPYRTDPALLIRMIEKNDCL